MSYQDCIDAIAGAAGDRLTEEDIAHLDTLLAARTERLIRRSGGTMDRAEAMAEAARQLGEEERRAAQIAKRNALLNLTARKARRGRIMGAPDPVLGMQAEIHGINTPVKGGRFSAEAEGHALTATYWKGALGELEKAGLFDTARRGTLEREWVRELAELNKAEGLPGLTKNREALAIAQILHRWQSVAKRNLNRAGAWIGDYQGFVAHSMHDPDRLWKAGRDAWIEDTLPLLDADRTFEGIEDPQRFMTGVWNALVTGVHLTAEGGMGFKDPAFSGPGNLAKRMSRSRLLHFRDADSWLDYQKRFGQPDALRGVMGSFERAARDTALMRRFGTNPRAEFAGDLRWLAEKLRDRDQATTMKLRSSEHDLQNRFDFLDGTANRPVNRLLARIGSTARVIESMAKLGGVAFTHLSSAATKAAELNYHGVGLFQGYGDFLHSFLRGRGHGDAREIMDLLGAGLEGMRRDLLSRFQPDDTLPGTLSKLANGFFKLTGLTYLMNAQKAGAEFVMSRHLGSLLDVAHDALPSATRRTLRLYGIGPLEWEMLRRAPDHPVMDGRTFLTPDAAHRIDGRLAEAHLRGNGTIREKDAPEAASAALANWRDDLAMRLHTLYHDIADRAIVTPGVAEKAVLLGGQQPGTPWGEAVRFFAQFKQWPAAAMRVGIGRELYGGRSRWAACAGILHMALGAAVTGYLAMTLKDLTKGRTPRPPNDPHSWEAALAQGGGFGILGDYLFGQYDRFGHNFAESRLGPVMGEGLGTVIDLWNRAKEGKDLAPETLRLALDNTPFVNLFYTRTALNYLFLYQVQEALNPGFLRRYERSIRENNAQSFIIPPSSVIPYGGGSNRLFQGGRR